MALTRVSELIGSNSAHIVVTPNIAHVWQARTMSDVKSAYERASLATPDGWPIVAALRLLGAQHTRQRVAGSDLAPLICTPDRAVALIGGRGQSAEAAAKALAKTSSPPSVVLVEPVPPMELDDQSARRRLRERIAASEPDVVILGLGVPKQESLALDLLEELDHGVILCAGATIDFMGGTVKRSPRWVRVIGFEWLFRITLEPRRMFGRYSKAAPYFVVETLRSYRRLRRRANMAEAPQS